MKTLSVIAASFALSIVAGQALAHCRDARKTCEFTAQCAKSNGARAKKFAMRPQEECCRRQRHLDRTRGMRAWRPGLESERIERRKPPQLRRHRLGLHARRLSGDGQGRRATPRWK